MNTKRKNIILYSDTQSSKLFPKFIVGALFICVCVFFVLMHFHERADHAIRGDTAFTSSRNVNERSVLTAADNYSEKKLPDMSAVFSFLPEEHVPPEVLRIRIAQGALNRARELTFPIVRLYGLSASEEKSANLALAAAFQKAEDQLPSRTVAISESDTTPQSSNDKLGRFRIRSSPDEGQRNLADLRGRLDQILGQDRGGKIFHSIDFTRYFGGMGLLQVDISFSYNKDLELTQYKYGIFNSDNVVMDSGESILSEMKPFYGEEIFQLEEKYSK